MSQYEYDKDSFRFRKAKKSAWHYVRKVLMFFVVTLSLAVVYYLIFALVFSTDTEQRLKNENRMYAREFPELERKEELLADVVEGLRLKDDRIYEEIFHTSAPSMDPLSSVDFLMGIDSIPDTDIVSYTERKLEHVEESASTVETNFARVMEMIRDFARKFHQTIIMVSHDAEMAAYADRILTLKDGEIISDEQRGISYETDV